MTVTMFPEKKLMLAATDGISGSVVDVQYPADAVKLVGP
jgi:hypothetical protein